MDDVHTMMKKKILIVEDDHTTAAIIQLYLYGLGYEVLEIAINAIEAIASARSLSPDVILMDINLGAGADGIKTAKAIMQELSIPIIYITVSHDDKTLKRAVKTKPAGFINKPIRETDLRTTISFALGKSSSQEKIKTKLNTNLKKRLTMLYKLSPAEIRVVEQLVVDPDLTAISNILDISVNTIRTHLKRLYRKTDTNSKSALLLKIINDLKKSS